MYWPTLDFIDSSPLTPWAIRSIKRIAGEKASDPYTLGAGLIGGTLVVANYELVLELIGIWGLILTAAVTLIK
eukprot:7594261-Pyramimonas_sp.AAC.1